jgi:nicotinate-nucleotide pyrophosphorylase (carboxylating)
MTDFFRQHRKHFNLKQFINNVLAEDVGDGDHTSLATISSSKKGKLQLLVKEDGIIAGVRAAEMIFKTIDSKISLRVFIKDGTRVKKGDVVFEVSGPVQKLLLTERIILNIMQRMSAIATKTAMLQSLCNGTKARVIDTRKTTPGFRFFEKWAVVIGGGANHRFGLYDMILIKDNHVDFAGGIKEAVTAAEKYLARKKKRIPIEVETRSISDVRLLLDCRAVQRIMLDNYTVADTKKAVKLINAKFEVESSGGITEKNIAAYARCGVDFISIGALTHHVKSLDLSLKAIF